MKMALVIILILAADDFNVEVANGQLIVVILVVANGILVIILISAADVVILAPPLQTVDGLIGSLARTDVAQYLDVAGIEIGVAWVRGHDHIDVAKCRLCGLAVAFQHQRL